MKNLLERKGLIELVRKIQDCNGTEKEQDELVRRWKTAYWIPRFPTIFSGAK